MVLVCLVNYRWYVSEKELIAQDLSTAIQSLVTITTSSTPSDHLAFNSESSEYNNAEEDTLNPLLSKVFSDRTPRPPPFRTVEEMKKDVQCLHHGKSFFHFYHMRKAGGSSIRQLLIDMMKTDSTPYPIHVSHTEGLTFNISCFDHGPRVYLTSLREPVDRIVSSYLYEGRQSRMEARMFPAYTIPSKYKDFAFKSGTVPKERNITFRGWVDESMARYAEDPFAFKTDHIWMDVDNYFLKTLTNRYRDVTQPLNAQDLELGKAILDSFDILLIVEWMDQKDQEAYLNKMLGTTHLMSFPHSLKTNLKKKKGYEALIDDSTLEYLRELNKYDLELYAYAKEVARQRIDASIAAGPDEFRLDDPSTCQPVHVHEPKKMYDGIKYQPTKNMYPDPVCQYPRDMWYDEGKKTKMFAYPIPE